MSHGGARQNAGRPKGIHTVFSKETIEKFRARIQVDMLKQRLEGLAAGTVEMPPHAVTAALGLLRKVVPDMATIEHSGEVATRQVVRAPTVSQTAKDWAEEYVPETQTEH